MRLAQTARPLSSIRLAAVTPRLATALLALNVAGLLAVSVGMRVWQLDHVPGINGDEAWYGIQAMRLINGEEVSWRTPTNNILNPFFFVPLAAFHMIASPSAALLRWPAALSGILALVVNYALCRRAFDRQTALVTTALLAVLPVNIAYSRFGWDTSQTLLATLPAVYLPLLAVKEAQHRPRWLLAAALVFLASLVVHPTNIFTAPLLAIPMLWVSRDELLAGWRQRRPAWQWITGGCLLIASLASVAWLARHWLGTMAGRVTSLSQLWEFAWHYQRLLSGLTVYRFIAGSNLPEPSATDLLLLDVACWSILGVASMGLWNLIRRPTTVTLGLDGCLVCGWAVTLGGFFLVAGPRAIAPHYERYALCLLAPAAVVLGRGISWWLSRAETRPLATAAALALGWLTLLGYQQHYFEFIHRTGGQSHDTFRTSELEPKQAALAQILRERNPDQVAWIVTAEYWNEQPLEYLAAGIDQLRVENWADVHTDPLLMAAAREGRVWFVEFANSDSSREVRELLAREELSYRETAIEDYAGRPVLAVFGPAVPCPLSPVP